MKRTSLGLFLVLSMAALSACTPTGAPPEDTDDGADSADPSAAAVETPVSGSLQIDALNDAIRAHEAAKNTVADPALVDGALRDLHARRSEHGLSMDDTFRVKNAAADEDGDVHVRVEHFYKGIRVEGSGAVARTDKGGSVRDAITSSLKKGIAVDTTPKLDPKAAKEAISARPERGQVILEPRADLVIFPITQRFVKETGLPLTADDVIVDALDLETRVVEYRLAYRVDTYDRGAMEPVVSHRFFVDASTGEVLKVKSLIEHGTGHAFKTNGPSNDFNVPMDTYAHTEDSPTWFEPRDAYREFGVWDDDYGNTSGSNHDGNDVWGDGLVFAGDASATLTNRQTAIADATYAMQGTWDMFDRVWNWRGYNNGFYSGHAYVHVGTGWDDASYNYLSGNISIGDSSGARMSIRTAYDTVAHEFGHGMNDFTADLGGNSEGEGLSEATGDIIAEISETYEMTNALANNSITIPTVAGIPNWFNTSSGRNFKTANGVRYWTSSLADLPDEHTRALPMIHMFYFLVNGVSSDPCATDGSMYLPWGSAGISIDHAARIFMRSLFYKFSSGTDYADARAQMLASASELYGSASAEYKAVQNAFAAIGVGSKMAGYPGSPVSMAETESNNNSLSADDVANGTLPAGTPLKGTLLKRTLVSGGVTASDANDFFSIGVPSGKHLRLCMYPWNDTDLYVYDGFDSLVTSSAAAGTNLETVTVTAPADGLTHPYSIDLRHFATTPTQIPFYQMYVDLY